MGLNMRNLKLTVMVVLLFALVICGFQTNTFAAGEKRLSILFTHDMHDHFLPSRIEKNSEVILSGGYARLKTAIDMERESRNNTILVDAGDYSMGTLFQSIFASDAPELRIMGQLGYDVATFGNHEFDFRDNGLARHLYAAKNSGDKLPLIVNSNIKFPAREKMTKPLLDLQNSLKAFGVKEYVIFEREGLKIGVFGLLGKDAVDSAPMTEVTFENIVDSAKDIVNKLKNDEKVDLIICLSHSGTSKIASASEDEQLARKVPEINVIISGHTHTKLEKPITVGNTVIGSCGEYSNYLGVIDMVQDSGGSWRLQDYNLKPVEANLKENKEILKSIDKYKSIVKQKYLNAFGMDFDEILAESQFSFIPTEKIGLEHREEPLGNLIADSYIYSVKKAEGDNYEPVSVAVVAAGTMRGSIVKGNITAADAFTISSLGLGADGLSGYPLISVYLTGKELLDLCEVDASISPIMSSAQLYTSGLSFTLNPNRMMFNRVTEVHLQKPDGSTEKLEEEKLYRVVTGLYNAQMLSIVGEKSFGLLSIVPKTRDGNPIEDFEARIIYDSSNTRKSEMKEWLSIAEYIKSFEKVGGIAEIPDYYKTAHGRKIIDNSKGITAVMGNPNRIAVKLYIILLLAAFSISFGVYLIIKLRKRRKNNISLKR